MAASKVDAVTEFTKTKMHFALALLGTLFALHNFMEKLDEKNIGFDYLGQPLKLYYAYGLMAGLLGLTVYFYGLALLSERGYSWMEKTGNCIYALAIMVFPLYGALYASNWAAQQSGVEDLAWAGPTVVPIGLGLAWLILSWVLAWLLRKRLGDRDRTVKAEELAEQEIAALNRAREMFEKDHYDLSVIEAWKAIETRLRRVFLARGAAPRAQTPEALMHAANRAGVLSKSNLALVQDLRRQWNVAVGVVPVTKEAADKVLGVTRDILSTIPIETASADKAPV
jgi:HEPN domain-containing protein